MFLDVNASIDHYIYGCKAAVQSDHKPFIPIFKKPLHAAHLKSLKRMLLQLGNYDLDVVYIPGTKISLADTLSRKHLPNIYTNTQKVWTLMNIALLVACPSQIAG